MRPKRLRGRNGVWPKWRVAETSVTRAQDQRAGEEIIYTPMNSIEHLRCIPYTHIEINNS